ncbi:MAG: flagellar hook-associated protein FlgK [Lachnospiraceae bacterium]|nr:flagellar hook-associated protein FlgK [Lachnospiraceae bacterium]
MSLFSGLYVGQSGIQTSQNALNTTAHNLSNIETQGYTRQQVLQQDRVYNPVMGNASISKMQSGLGVEYAKVVQVRDQFVDASYRKEVGRASFYDTYYEATKEIDTFLGELTGTAFKDSLTNLWTSVEELQKDPSSAVTEGQFVSNASQFVDRAQAVYDGLKDYQDNLNAQVKDTVDKINEIGNEICKYNLMITRVETGKAYNANPEEANDYRDARNLLLDELGKYVNMSYDENIYGEVEVSVEGVNFIVSGKYTPFELGVVRDNATGFYTPVWPTYNDMEVYDCNQEISTKLNTNIGGLKALVLARGDRRANYTDLMKDPNTGEDIYNDGARQSVPPKMATSNSVIMNVMAEFDSLIHNVVTEVNNILTGETTEYDPELGTDVHDATYKDDAKYPKKLPKELFQRLSSDRYELQADGSYKYVTEDSSKSPADTSTMYTIANLRINPELLKEPTLLGYPDSNFTTEEKNVDQTKADKLAEAFSAASMVLNPNITQKTNFASTYSNMVSQLASAGYIYKSISESQNDTATQLDYSRQQITGVSSNEELANMIKFQNAFNASSRYINAVNEMIEHVINRLGG